MFPFRFQLFRIAGFAGLILSAGMAIAQTPTWTQPTAGYIYDPFTHAIRFINGFVGSSVLGSAVFTGVDWASVAPNKTSALAVRGNSITFIADLSNPGQSQTVEQIPSAARVEALWASDSSQAVVLVSGSQLSWLNGLPASPVMAANWKLDTSPARPGRREIPGWSLLAADSAADKVLIAQSGSDQLDIVSKEAPPAAVSFSGRPTAAVFLVSGNAAYVADTLNHQVVELQGLDGATPTSTPILTSESYVNQTAGIALSADNSRLFVVDQAAQTVSVFTAATGNLLSQLPVQGTPTSLTIFDAGRFLLNATAKTPPPVFILDTGAPPQLLFIPRGE